MAGKRGEGETDSICFQPSGIKMTKTIENRILAVAVLCSVYFLVLAFFSGKAGGIVAALSIFPVGALGYYYNWKVGAVSGAVVGAINMAFFEIFAKVNIFPDREVIGWSISSAMLIAVGGFTGYLHFLTTRVREDAKELRELEKELALYRGNIETICAERTKELTNEKEQSEHENRSKSEFLANASHELRTPLNSVLGFAEILRDGRYGKLNEKQEEYVAIIRESGKEVLRLIDDIVDLSKTSFDGSGLDVSWFSIKSMVEHELSIVKIQALKKQVAIEVEVAGGIGGILADELKIKRVFYNLLDNAVKFTPPGGAVKVRVEKTNDGIRVSVVDTGRGIENAGRLFSGSAAGQGLTTVKNIVELHGGKVWVVSSGKGAGSVFYFSLPSAVKA